MSTRKLYTLAQIIEQSAMAWPDKQAFRANGKAITFAELERKSNALAHALHKQGVRRRDRVGIYLETSTLESAIAVNGIWKAGAAYVPLDPRAPVTRLGFVLRDCDIRVIVSDDSMKSRGSQLADEPGLECILGHHIQDNSAVDSLSWNEIFSEQTGYAPSVQLIEQDLAYIMYTSGSTGTPKGIIHTHYSGLSYAKLSVNTYDVIPGDVIGNSAPLHFDISTFGFFSGPLAGATTSLVPDIYTKFPANLSQFIEEEAISIWYSVPFILVQLVRNGVLSERDLSALRWVLFGGEPFPVADLGELMRCLPQARFSNVYGPAEVNQCTYYHLPCIPTEGKDYIPIGKTWDKTEAIVLDETGSPDMEGELLIRSPTMMHGYWNRPNLDEKAFFFRSTTLEGDTGRQDHHDRFYRTGDLVRLEKDGNYRFIGRIDDQVKIRGFRVELGEIDNALQSYAGISEGYAFRTTRPGGSMQIEAAVQPQPESMNILSGLAEHLKSLLPWYAIPAEIHTVDNFPRTSSGKIDRNQLTKI